MRINKVHPVLAKVWDRQGQTNITRKAAPTQTKDKVVFVTTYSAETKTLGTEVFWVMRYSVRSSLNNHQSVQVMPWSTRQTGAPPSLTKTQKTCSAWILHHRKYSTAIISSFVKPSLLPTGWNVSIAKYFTCDEQNEHICLSDRKYKLPSGKTLSSFTCTVKSSCSYSST